MLCSSGAAGILLKEEFPSFDYQELPGYKPRYPKGNSSMVLTLGRQGPHFASVIRAEHEAMRVLVKRVHPHAIISENRYGCFAPSVLSVLISHQLKIRMPSGWGFLSPLANGRIRSYTRNFTTVWVPDQPDGELTAPFVSEKIPHRYIGWLSRFTPGPSLRPAQGKLKASGIGAPGNLGYPEHDIVAIVSGPEPQRSALEQLIRREFTSFQGKSILVQGKPGEPFEEQVGNCLVINHLSATELEPVLRGAGLVISRGGYSTVMDLIVLGKKAVFIPTPQQTEQLYIAASLMKRRIAFSMDQENFELKTALREAPSYSGFGGFKNTDGLLTNEIKQLLS
jgi:UDP-N-acetylglucosamine transferase subunit ALG13